MKTLLFSATVLAVLCTSTPLSAQDSTARFDKIFGEPDARDAFHQKRRIISIQPLLPLSNEFSAGYEVALRPGLNLRLDAGYFGISNQYTHGGYMTASLRMPFRKNYYLTGEGDRHWLEGLYWGPSFSYGSQSVFVPEGTLVRGSYNTLQDARYIYSSGAALMTVGHQWIIRDIFTIDIYAGAGVGFYRSHVLREGEERTVLDAAPVDFGSHAFSNEFPWSIRTGLSIGILLK